MTDEQFQRWKDFALRMARTCYPATMRAPSRKWIVDRVEEFIDQMEDDRERITDWDSSWPEPPGSTYRSFECVSDRMSEFEWDNLPWRVQKLEHDEKFEEFEEAIDRWFGPVKCCVRAGLDLASAPSAGVVGFTIGDLRRMYPEGIPDWIASGFHGPRGGRVPACKIRNATDDTAVWL